MSTVAAIMADPEYDPVAMVQRRRWIVAINTLGPTRQRYTHTRKQAVEWCAEMGITTVVMAKPVRESR